MEPLLEFVGQFWWLAFVFGGSIAGGARALGAANQRRAERRQERFRIKHETKVEIARARALGGQDSDARRREIDRLCAEHDRVDQRWLAYELDLVNVLDFPMMIDLTEPLTADFHRAKRHADLARPSGAQDLVDDPVGHDAYRAAVLAYAAAFDAAEAEARRRRRSDFDRAERDRIERAQRLLALALDEAGSAAERRQAYRRARAELDGVLALPTATVDATEQRIAGALEQ